LPYCRPTTYAYNKGYVVTFTIVIIGEHLAFFTTW